jgi:hypothetical protein
MTEQQVKQAFRAQDLRAVDELRYREWMACVGSAWLARHEFHIHNLLEAVYRSAMKNYARGHLTYS